MIAPVLLIGAILALAALYVLLPVIASVYARYRGEHSVVCPETGEAATVHLDAGYAGLSAAVGPPDLSVRGCSCWPQREGCEQSCLHQLAPAPPVRRAA
jgi:hypothetical protein